MRTDGQSDMTNLTVAFNNFSNAPKTGLISITTRQLGIYKPRRQRILKFI
jgi:hypothetical protein